MPGERRPGPAGAGHGENAGTKNASHVRTIGRDEHAHARRKHARARHARAARRVRPHTEPRTPHLFWPRAIRAPGPVGACSHALQTLLGTPAQQQALVAAMAHELPKSMAAHRYHVPLDGVAASGRTLPCAPPASRLPLPASCLSASACARARMFRLPCAC